MVKILHVGKYFPPRYGGIENFMSQLMRRQAMRGNKVSAVVHTDKRAAPKSRETWNKCALYHSKSYGQVVYAPLSPGFPLVLSQALEAEEPDIIHIHMPNLSAFWLLLSSRAKRAKWVIHWHSDVVGAAPDLKVKLLYPFYRIFEYALLTKADAIICTSPNYLETSQPLKSFLDKCHVIPLGIETEETVSQNARELCESELQARPGDINSGLDQCPSKIDSEPDAKPLKLIFLGRLTYYKGHQFLLEALSQLQDEQLNFHLDIVGAGELDEQLKCLVESLSLNGCVTFHGVVSDNEKRRLLVEADLLCLTSIERTEAFGVVLLEAGFYGLPALVSDVRGSGMTYVIEHEENGFVSAAGDRVSIKKLIRKSAEDRMLLIRMGMNAKERILNIFALEVIEQKIASLYVGKLYR